MAEGRYAEKMRADDQARRLGVRLHPTFDINGRRVEGALPSEELSRILDEALARGRRRDLPSPRQSLPADRCRHRGLRRGSSDGVGAPHLGELGSTPVELSDDPGHRPV